MSRVSVNRDARASADSANLLNSRSGAGGSLSATCGRGDQPLLLIYGTPRQIRPIHGRLLCRKITKARRRRRRLSQFSSIPPLSPPRYSERRPFTLSSPQCATVPGALDFFKRRAIAHGFMRVVYNTVHFIYICFAHLPARVL